MNKKATTVADVLSPATKYLGFKPGMLPRPLSGALTGTLISTLLGAGAGRYLAAPILRRLYPELDEERLNRVSTVMGGAAGFAPGAYMMYKTYQGAGGPRGWFGGLENLKPEQPKLPAPAPASAPGMVKAQSSVSLRRLIKHSGFFTRRPVSAAWTQPSIPAGTTQATLDAAVASGALGVYDAANIAQIMEEARPQGSGLISPSSVARAAVSYGIGALAGRALGAVANATFGSFNAGEQKNLARGVGLGNLLFDALGRLASP